MSEKFIRVYKKLDIRDIKSHLLIYGDLSASCAGCNTMDFKLETTHCPGCRAEFKYIGFRNIKTHFPKIQKLAAERPHLIIIDYDDYIRGAGAMKAREFLQ